MSKAALEETATSATAANDSVVTPISLEEVEAMTNDLKRLLVKYESTLEQQGLRKEIATLERWMESYRHGLSAAHKIAEKGPGWLSDLRGKLQLATDELLRLEGEGGNSLSESQLHETEEMTKAVRRIDLVMPNIEQIFNPAGLPPVEETKKAS